MKSSISDRVMLTLFAICMLRRLHGKDPAKFAMLQLLLSMTPFGSMSLQEAFDLAEYMMDTNVSKMESDILAMPVITFTSMDTIRGELDKQLNSDVDKMMDQVEALQKACDQWKNKK